MELFVERARKVRPDFAVSEENARSVAEICSELDGLPLAIELAAARVRMLSAEQIAKGLSDRFRLLTGGPRTATPRPKTLRASVDWSHELLSADERALLRRLAVFAGGFTLEAAEQVCAGDGIERDRVLDLLASLVDQSLVIAEEGAARGALPPAGDRAPVRAREAGRGRRGGRRCAARHRDHFLALAERAGSTPRDRAPARVARGPRSRGGQPRRRRSSARCAASRRSRFASARRSIAGGAPAVASPRRSWRIRARSTPAGTASPRCAHACSSGRAYVAINAGEYEAAEAHATEALALADGGRRRGDRGAGALRTR